MNFDLTEEQEMLRKTARDFYKNEITPDLLKESEESKAGYSIALWRRMAGLGWMGLAYPEKYGGMGLNFLDLVILLEEMGRGGCPSPFLETVAAGLLVLQTGSENQKKEHLGGISEGRVTASLAVLETAGSYEPAAIAPAAVPTKTGFTVNGKKLFVTFGASADYLLCAGRQGGKDGDGLTLLIIDAKTPGLQRNNMPVIIGEKQCEVIFQNTPVPAANVLGEPGHGWPHLQKVLDMTKVAQSASALGAAEQMLEMSVSYAKERVQFGHPIGSFQAVQHHIANMVSDVDGLRCLVYEAGWKISRDLRCDAEAAMAKAWAIEAVGRVIRLSHQVHGAIGFTADHQLQRFTKQAKAWEYTLGDADYQRRQLASAIF